MQTNKMKAVHVCLFSRSIKNLYIFIYTRSIEAIVYDYERDSETHVSSYAFSNVFIVPKYGLLNISGPVSFLNATKLRKLLLQDVFCGQIMHCIAIIILFIAQYFCNLELLIVYSFRA